MSGLWVVFFAAVAGVAAVGEVRDGTWGTLLLTATVGLVVSVVDAHRKDWR